MLKSHNKSNDGFEIELETLSVNHESRQDEMPEEDGVESWISQKQEEAAAAHVSSARQPSGVFAGSSQVAAEPKKEVLAEHTFKIIVVGNTTEYSGDLSQRPINKTSLIKKYVHGVFSKQYKSTIGLDFALKDIQIDHYLLKLQLWDVAGQNRFGSMTRVYYKDANAAIIVCDPQAPNCAGDLQEWINHIDANLENTRKIVVALTNDGNIDPNVENTLKTLVCENSIEANDFYTVNFEDDKSIAKPFETLAAILAKTLPEVKPLDESDADKGKCLLM